MKTTQIVTHIIPTEIDDYSKMVDCLKEASEFLEKTDWVSIYATLNLSPMLINWKNSELKPDFFIERFNQIKEKVSWANEIIFEIIDDNSILGTTAQKRKAIKGDYDQFIFLDPDIVFHPTTLKYMLESSYQIDDEYFIISPQTIKLWDSSWDVLVNRNFYKKDYGYQKYHNPKTTHNQQIEDVSLYKFGENVETTIYSSIIMKNVNTNENFSFCNFKFVCGWFTLYSKKVMDLIGIPEWLGQYGMVDKYIMYMLEFHKLNKWPVIQYVLHGLYIHENYYDRDTKYNGKVKVSNIKQKLIEWCNSIIQNKVNQAKNNIPVYKK